MKDRIILLIAILGFGACIFLNKVEPQPPKQILVPVQREPDVNINILGLQNRKPQPQRSYYLTYRLKSFSFDLNRRAPRNIFNTRTEAIRYANELKSYGFTTAIHKLYHWDGNNAPRLNYPMSNRYIYQVKYSLYGTRTLKLNSLSEATRIKNRLYSIGCEVNMQII
jgi:hypothetical protein